MAWAKLIWAWITIQKFVLLLMSIRAKLNSFEKLKNNFGTEIGPKIAFNTIYEKRYFLCFLAMTFLIGTLLPLGLRTGNLLQKWAKFLCYTFRINTSTSIHITRKLKILHLCILWLLYIDKLDKFIFQKRGLKALFSANHWAAICRIRKNAAFWLAEKILLIHFVRINRLNVFAGDLLTEN